MSHYVFFSGTGSDVALLVFFYFFPAPGKINRTFGRFLFALFLLVNFLQKQSKKKKESNKSETTATKSVTLHPAPKEKRK